MLLNRWKNKTNPQAGKTLYSTGFYGTVSSSGEIITAENALNVSAVYSCINVKANAIGKMSMSQYIKTDKGSDRVTNHQIAYLIEKRPNPYMTPFVFKHTLTVHRNLYGICYVRMELDPKGNVKHLHILQSGRISVVEDAEKKKFYVDSTDVGNPVVYDESEILRFPYLTVDGFTAKSPISVAREQAGNIKKQQQFMGNFYANGAQGGGIIKLPTKLEKNAKAKVREAWQEANSGSNNAGKVMVLDAGMEFESFEMPLKDLEFITSMKFNINDICRIFNVPPHMIGVTEGTNFSTLEQMSMEFILNTLHPEIKGIEEEMDYKLFTETEQKQGHYVRFNLNSSLRGDSQARATFYQVMIDKGIMSINEVRALEELDSIEHGDMHMASLNYVSLDFMKEYQETKAKGGG